MPQTEPCSECKVCRAKQSQLANCNKCANCTGRGWGCSMLSQLRARSCENPRVVVALSRAPPRDRRLPVEPRAKKAPKSALDAEEPAPAALALIVSDYDFGKAQCLQCGAMSCGNLEPACGACRDSCGVRIKCDGAPTADGVHVCDSCLTYCREKTKGVHKVHSSAMILAAAGDGPLTLVFFRAAMKGSGFSITKVCTALGGIAKASSVLREATVHWRSSFVRAQHEGGTAAVKALSASARKGSTTGTLDQRKGGRGSAKGISLEQSMTRIQQAVDGRGNVDYLASDVHMSAVGDAADAIEAACAGETDPLQVNRLRTVLRKVVDFTLRQARTRKANFGDRADNFDVRLVAIANKLIARVKATNPALLAKKKAEALQKLPAAKRAKKEKDDASHRKSQARIKAEKEAGTYKPTCTGDVKNDFDRRKDKRDKRRKKRKAAKEKAKRAAARGD